MRNHLDEAIDGAVREMLDVEPRADLRARVIERLPASGSRLPAAGCRRPAFSFRLPAAGWVLGSLAAAAVLVVAVSVTRRSDTVAPPSAMVAQRGDTRLPAPDAPDAPAAPERTARMADRALIAQRRPAVTDVERPAQSVASGTVVAASVDDDSDATSIAPLETMAPIAMPGIEQERIAPAAIAVRPLSPITVLQIAPLTPPDRR